MRTLLRAPTLSSDKILQGALEAQSSGAWQVALDGFQQLFRLAVGERDVVAIADVFRRIGNLHTARGDLELAMESFGTSLTIAELNELPEQTAAALICIASLEVMAGELDKAEPLFRRARTIAGEVRDARLGAMANQNIGTICNIRGDVHSALRHYTDALERFEELGDERGSVGALNNMGMAYVDLESWAAAERCFTRAYGLADRLQDARLLGHVEVNRAELHLRQQDYRAARESCDRAFETFGTLGSELGLAEVNKFYGILYRETGKLRLASTHLDTAIELAVRCGDRLLHAEAMSEWALVHLADERNPEALDCLNRAHRLFSELHASRELLDLDRRLDGLEATYLRVVAAWADSIEAKDRYTAGHCERVANYACLLAHAVGIGGRDLTWMRMGGYLHDVGKIAVPEEVLNKPGKLDPDEWRLMQSHTTEGDAIVAELNFPWDIRPIVRSHHERWDGSGYPDRLAGEEIPLEARILCVADVYDALTTTRSYRPAMSREEALHIMEQDAGRIFDPELFALFRDRILQVSALPDRRFPVFARESEVAA